MKLLVSLLMVPMMLHAGKKNVTKPPVIYEQELSLTSEQEQRKERLQEICDLHSEDNSQDTMWLDNAVAQIAAEEQKNEQQNNQPNSKGVWSTVLRWVTWSK